MTNAGPSLAARYQELQEEMNRLHDGSTLQRAVADVLDRLPEGALALFSTSDQGAGLAAACAAQRADATVWRRINLAYAPDPPAGRRVVIVEALDGGLAWRNAVARRYPRAEVLVADLVPAVTIAA